MMEKVGSGLSFGKVILLGEHGVVYGHPALVEPLRMIQCRTMIRAAQRTEFILDGRRYDGDQLDHRFLGLKLVFDHIRAVLGCQDDLAIEISSTIPIQRGLGSSAAFGVSLIRALYDYYDHGLDDDSLFELAMISERYYHGNPSGLDPLICLKNECIYYQKNQGYQLVSHPASAYLVVADSGETGSTRTALELVENQLNKQPQRREKIENLGQYARKGLKALQAGNAELLGTLFNQAQIVLDSLELSTNRLDEGIRIAREYGALGSKLTGSGLGGCMIALVKEKECGERIREKLRRHGFIQTWIQPL